MYIPTNYRGAQQKGYHTQVAKTSYATHSMPHGQVKPTMQTNSNSSPIKARGKKVESSQPSAPEMI